MTNSSIPNPIVTKLILNEPFYKTGIIGETSEFIVSQQNQLVVIVENVDSGNTVVISGQIIGQTGFTTLYSGNGAFQATIDVTLYDLVQFQCAGYQALGGVPTLIVSSFFSPGGGGVTIGKPVAGGQPGGVLFEDGSGNVQNDADFTTDGYSVNISGNLSVGGTSSLDGGSIYTDGGGDMTIGGSVQATNFNTLSGGGVSADFLSVTGSTSLDNEEITTDGNGNLAVVSIETGQINDIFFTTRINISNTPGTLNDQYGNPQLYWDNNGVSINSLSKPNTYNVNTLAGQGFASIIYNTVQTTQSASVGSTTIVTAQATPATGSVYRINSYVSTDNAGSGGTVSMAIQFTDHSNTATSVNALSTTNVSLGTVGAFGQGSVIVAAKAATTVHYTITYTVGTGSPRYNYYIVAERIQ